MTVRTELRGDALWLTIDREERRNALSSAVIDGLTEGLSSNEGRVVVITGTGDRAFCAGGDLGGFTGGESPPAAIGRLMRALRGCPRPVVARVQGLALGGGFGLLLGCDLAVAADDAELGTPEVNVGLWPHVITAAIQRNVPRKIALELMLTGRRIGAVDAARWGIVNRAVPRAELDAAIEELVMTLASKSAHVLALGKESYRGAEDLAFDDAVAFLTGMLERNLEAEDLREGVQAFLEKRAPVWRDR